MKTFDPYEVLGVSREADDEAIKAAFRSAAKRAHPDAGGSVDAFQRVRRAEVVLLDPAKRRKFDATGMAEDESPDNVRAAALQIISGFLDAAVAAYVAGFDPAKDPRCVDLLGAFRAKMAAEIAGLRGQIGEMTKGVAFLEDFASRFSGDPGRPIELVVAERTRSVRAQIEHCREGIAAREAAVEIVSAYNFRFEVPPPPSWLPRSAGPTGWGSGTFR